MKMAFLEKIFINSEKHGQQVIKRADRLLDFIDAKKTRRYLEVGCGNGAVARYIAEKYPWDVTAVDVDPEQIKLTQESSKNLKNIRFVQTDATKLPFPENDFDIVLSFGTTHHIPDWLSALSEMRRVLKPEGYFIYYDLVYPKLLAKLGRSISRNYGIITMPELDSFIRANHYSKIYASMKNSLIWYDYQAIYKSA